MKKGFLGFVLAVSLVLSCGSYALAESALRVGYSFNERLTSDTGGTATTKEVGLGMDLSYELTMDGNSFESGFGVTYQRPRALNDDTLTFQSIPIYGIFALEVSETETNNVYLIGKLGLNYFNVSDLPDAASAKIGYYYAYGFGMKVGPYFRTQALYEVYTGSVSAAGVSTDYTNKAYTLKCGYAF
jgi:hypothetical protein